MEDRNKIRYKLIDNKTGNVSEYSSFAWFLAWELVFILGIGVGILISL